MRETLSVLLEHDCQLRFLDRAAAASAEVRSAGVALVATRARRRLLHDLRRHWPLLPIVAVDLVAAGATGAPPATDDVEPQDIRLQRVPLEPHAIRASVLQQLAPVPDASVAAAVRAVAEPLRKELAYCFAAVRTFSTLHATSAGPDTYALLGAVMREQSYILSDVVAQLERFRSRPRLLDTSPDFATALCHELERVESPAAERGVVCDCAVEAPCGAAGPTSLIPTVATFLRAHIRRRSDAPVVSVRVTHRGVVIRYPHRRPVTGPPASWPLLLASLALRPFSWSVSTGANGQHEVVSLCAAA